MLHILNFVRLHGAAELLDQNPAPLSELLGAGFCEPLTKILRCLILNFSVVKRRLPFAPLSTPRWTTDRKEARH
jgi:hypothetical protein